MLKRRFIAIVSLLTMAVVQSRQGQQAYALTGGAATMGCTHFDKFAESCYCGVH
jgi:hypothetical protein